MKTTKLFIHITLISLLFSLASCVFNNETEDEISYLTAQMLKLKGTMTDISPVFSSNLDEIVKYGIAFAVLIWYNSHCPDQGV